jgi:hypothetical protein
MDREAARRAFRAVRDGGCRAVHIGGGEPFMDPVGLTGVLAAAAEHGVAIDYIETNSSWFRGEASAVPLLKELKTLGAAALLVSMSPFHAEYVPFSRVQGVVSACRRAGVSVFPWVEEFVPELTRLDGNTTHTLEELAALFGEGYMRGLPARYWIHMGGRAAVSYKDILPARSAQEIAEVCRGCAELADTSHFHVDLDGRYVPGLCSGMGIHLRDIGSPLDPAAYPLVSLLHGQGIGAFLAWAREKHGFTPRGTYVSKCHLCVEIRRFLVMEKGLESMELSPREYYTQL